MVEILLIIFVFALGTCIGSFLNVVIYRMPRDESIAWPPSHCPSCGRHIRWYDNIPILSWLALRGRCRYCKTSISAQYIIVELVTGLLVVGLYAAYFIERVRVLGLGINDRAGPAQLNILTAWPMFIAHAALVCGLLACAVVDWRHYIVPLPVMWTVALVGVAAAAFRPHPFLAQGTAGQAAVAVAACVGLLISLYAVRAGLLRPSFLEVPDRPVGLDEDERPRSQPRRRAGDRPNRLPEADGHDPQARPQQRRKEQRQSVGATADDGISPRREVLREVLFLLPAAVLAMAAWALLHYVPAANAWWSGWFDPARHPVLGPRVAAVGGSVFGFLIGGLWIWGLRIVATLAAGREAMGMGDVHILAGVGAVAGWVVPSLVFFAAPVSGVAVALYLFLTRRQRELPYGPWLAIGTVLVLLLYDVLVRFVEPGATGLVRLLSG
jgi:leader peptidase (prepilin peptidase)/N-methyltransferase